MNRDENKFTLFAYEKNNIDNKQPIYYIKDGKEIKKTYLSCIDSITSKIKHQYLYEYLLKNNVISKEQTEFVIFYNEKSNGKNIIKQLPVIFDDNNIKLYSEYLLGNNDEEHKEKFNKLNENTFWNFIDIIDKNSKEYDKLNLEEQNSYMSGKSFSASFSRLPFALSSFKKRVKDRILGFYQINKHDRVKDNKKLSYANFNGIKKDIETSYRDFRDSYLFLRNKINLEEIYKDLYCDNYEVLLEKKEVIKMERKDEINELKQMKEVIKQLEKKYNVEDYLELINNFETRESFNDFVWNSKLVTKKVKAFTNRLACSMFDSESDNYYSESVIKSFNSLHPGVINKLINEYYNLNPQKKKVKTI